MYKELDDYEILYLINDDENYYDILFKKYRPIIISLAKKYSLIAKNIGYEMEDLIQIGNVALMEAIHSYRDQKNALFYTFFIHCLNNKFKTELRNNDTNRKKVLNESVSYDAIVPGTDRPLVDFLVDQKVLNPIDSILEEELEIKYWNFLNSLPFEVSVAVEMQRIGFSIDEISKFLDVEKKIVLKFLNLARRRRFVYI